jgi:FtsH-binding integral membrane protein
METQNYNYTQEQQPETLAKGFVSNVFSWMFLALTITGLMSYLFSHNLRLLSVLITETGLSTFGYIVMFAPLAFVLVLNFGLEKLSFAAVVGLFVLYSVTMGISLSFIFLIYTEAFIANTFFITAGAFGAMAALGYFTKTDLTKMGMILTMALIGVIIASVVMMFTGGDTFLIDCACVVIFTGLAAYKMQMIKNMGMMANLQTEDGKKLAVSAALSLYITFINLFLTLLRLFGGRR